MRLDTDFLDRCVGTLGAALERLEAVEDDPVAYDIFRAGCVKEFEIILEQCGSLLKKRLRPYFASNRQADTLVFKAAFRHAARHGLIPVEACERWLGYRDSRNDTAHKYGEAFAEAVLELLPRFVADAEQLAAIIGEPFDD